MTGFQAGLALALMLSAASPGATPAPAPVLSEEAGSWQQAAGRWQLTVEECVAACRACACRMSGAEWSCECFGQRAGVEVLK